MYWRVVNHFSSHLTERHVVEHFEFYGKILSGKSEMKPLNERAIDEITGSDFGQLLGKKFVEKHYSEEAQRRVNEMVDNLLIVFRDRINGLDWMSEETKKEAVNKIKFYRTKIRISRKLEGLFISGTRS
jgi:putative endopeptidase